MSILEIIKGEKKMSFNHWRYRLLHWCFNEKAKTPAESAMPHFLYSHYCPLFHLTNLIAILAPIVLFIKIACSLGSLVVKGISKIPFSEIWEKIISKAEMESTEENLETAESKIAKQTRIQKKKFLSILCEKAKITDEDMSDEDFFNYVWTRFTWRIEKELYFKLEEAKEYFDSVYGQIKEAREKAKVRKEKLKERMIFWTNFSQVFLKWTFSIFYVVLALTCGWAAWKFVVPCYRAICAAFKWAASFDIMPILIWAVRIGFLALFATVVVYIFWRFDVFRKVLKAVWKAIHSVSPPFILVALCVVAPFKWAHRTIVAVIDFISIYYENNCPPIIIVSSEEEIIENMIEE